MFSSKANYNVLYKELSGIPSEAQITAFEDTWHWTEETEDTFQEIINIAPATVIEMMNALQNFIKRNDMMAYLTMMCIRLIELKRVLKNTGSIYLHCDPTASHYLKILLDTIFGKKHFQNEIVWAYNIGGKSKKRWARKHDIIFFYSKTQEYFFDGKAAGIPRETGSKSFGGKIGIDKDGRKYQDKLVKSSGKYYRYYLDEPKIPEDFWYIQSIQSQDKERLGYPTQKPEELLERIIKASSNKGDIVLDPFCGCGTAIAVAEKHERKWMGIDVTHLAINLIKRRMKDTHNISPKKDYKVTGEPEDLSGAIELASQNRFQFQWWALSLIDHSKPYQGKKKGADTGIDGYIYHHEEKIIRKAIVQIKSGKVQAKDIRELCRVVDRDQATIGIFITLKKPTKPMEKEAIAKGFYEPKQIKKRYRKIQILTVEDILKGQQPEIPHPISPFKKAEQVMSQEEIGF